MLRPEPMLRVQLLAKRSDERRLIDLLADLKAVHLESHRKERISGTELDIGTPLQGADALSSTLTVVRSLLSKLPPSSDARVAAWDGAMGDMAARVDALSAEYAAHEERTLALSRDAQRVAEQERLLTMVQGLEGPVDALLRAHSVEPVLAARTPQSRQDALREVKPLMEMHGQGSLLMIVRKGTADAARAALKVAGFEIVELSPLRGLEGTVVQAREALARERERIAGQRDEEESFSRRFASHAAFLKGSEQALALELLKAQAPLHFGETKRTVLIRGFIPEAQEAAFRRRLESSGIDTVMDLAHAHEAPTKLDNPPVLDSFEDLVRLYTLPRYNEIDPTSLMAITFPLFFGFMLGDIGYGLCVLALAIVLLRMPDLKGFGNILLLSAIASVVFGAVFGEFFGLEHVFGLELHPLINRAHDTTTMLLIAIGIGVAHITLGLLIGIVNEAHHEGIWMGLLKKGSWILLEIGAILAAAAYGLLKTIPVLNQIAVAPPVAWAVLALAVIGIYAGEKLQGLFELPAIFGNTFSYARLVAIGLSSVYLALVINDMGGGLVAKGGIWLAVGILVILFGHALNLALGLLGPFLHSLRLHYAEFFTKFYAGGGTEYRPFGTVEGEPR